MAARPTDRRARNLVMGRAHFVDDRMPARRMLEVALVGSPYARAEIAGIDIAAALRRSLSEIVGRHRSFLP